MAWKDGTSTGAWLQALRGVTIFALACCGCRVHVGENHLLFVTRQNVGIDVDTLPSVAEASAWSRFEGVVAPTFEGGQTPAVVANFRVRNPGAAGVFPDLGTVFAAGPAAVGVAEPGNASTGAPALSALEKDAEIRLSRVPFSNESRSSTRLFEVGDSAPMWFGTTTSFALEFEFYGPGFPAIPQSAHLGYRRKEFLVAPLTVNDSPDGDGMFVVYTPSVLALVDVHADVGEKPKRLRKRTVQFFATGKAATRIAARGDVRHLFVRELESGATKSQLMLKELQLDLQRAKNELHLRNHTEP